MKVLQINATYGHGSTGRNVAELHTYMQKQGIDSYVAYGEKRTVNDDRVFYIGCSTDHKFHGLMSRITGKQAYFSKIATRKLCKKIRKIMPNVIHLHNVHGNYLNFPMIMKFANKHNIPVMLNLHDCWFFTGKCCHYFSINCDKWQKQCGNCPQLKTNNVSWFFDQSKKVLEEKKRLFSMAKLGVIGVSDWILGQAKESILKDAFLLKRIYNWIDTEKFKPRENVKTRKDLSIPKDQTIILAVSQGWDENKGLKDLIKVAENFTDSKVVLVGRPPKNKNLPGNIIVIPYVNNIETLTEIYSAADVFVNPSRMETFGKVTAEAMACGTPAIVYNNTGNKELVNDSVGACAKNLDINDLIAKIRFVLAKGKAFYKENCINSVKERFSMQDRLEEYVKAYKELIN